MVYNHPDYATQVLNNTDSQNRMLALRKIIQDSVGKERKRELELYKKYASDPDFQRAFNSCIVRLLEKGVYDVMSKQGKKELFAAEGE